MSSGIPTDDTIARSLHAALAHGAALLDREPVAAAEQARAILKTMPDQPGALRLLGRALRRLGQNGEAADSERGAIEASLRQPDLRAAGQALASGELARAERLLRSVLQGAPDDAAALMMLADIAARLGILGEAETKLRQAIAIAPDYPNLQVNLAQTLFLQRRSREALATLDAVMAREPGHVRAALIKADIFAQSGEYDEAVRVYEALAARAADSTEVWIGYGHLLKTVGRQDDSVAAYRRATALDPANAEAWWSLAELKSGRTGPSDVAEMQRALDLAQRDSARLLLHFALGKAHEDQERWKQSFDHYAEANRLRLQLEPHDRSLVTREVDRSIALYTHDFLDERAGQGDPSPDPIFIVGMPRAGSTLIEQILASHPQIEGTAELPHVPQLVQALVASRWQDRRAAYPDIVSALSPQDLRKLGQRYLENAAQHRKTKAPFFVDKLPNNWRYIGLIRLIMPNARIVDARRGAMACCFSNFKQHFARGQTFAYSLSDLGAYYRDYRRMMAHFFAVTPGAIQLVEHERLLDDPEAEIRRLLASLGLPFDENCLRPHENHRPVRTASSEQVRRPISRAAVDQWRNYEPWLAELKTALGDLA